MTYYISQDRVEAPIRIGGQLCYSSVENLLQYLCAKNYQNIWSMDKVIAKNKRVQFFLPHIVYSRFNSSVHVNPTVCNRHNKNRTAPTAECCHLANLTAWSQSHYPSIMKVSWPFLPRTMLSKGVRLSVCHMSMSYGILSKQVNTVLTCPVATYSSFSVPNHNYGNIPTPQLGRRWGFFLGVVRCHTKSLPSGMTWLT